MMQLINKNELHLNVPLTEDEKAEESKCLISQLDDFEVLERQAKESAKAFKESMDDSWADIQATRQLIKKGPAKLVKCHVFLDAEQERVITIRTDTGEEVSSRPAEEEDYQTKMEIFSGIQAKQAV